MEKTEKTIMVCTRNLGSTETTTTCQQRLGKHYESFI